jgi:hypothetical protein
MKIDICHNILVKHFSCHIYIVQCWVVLARFCPIIVQVKPLKTPFGLVTPFITIPITRSYNHTQLLLTPLHNYNPCAFVPTIAYCTVAPLTIASWLSVFDSTADCCLRRLAHWLDCVSCSSFCSSRVLSRVLSVTVEIQPKVAFFGPSRSHPAKPFRNALSRVGYWGNVGCLWNVGIRNHVSGNRCIRNHGYLYPVA